MASNLMVTLMSMAQEVLASIDIDRRQAMSLLEPLVRGTLDTLAQTSPEEALTGPVSRGDLGTLRAHGLALRKDLPQLVPAYAALSVETVRLAVRRGHARARPRRGRADADGADGDHAHPGPHVAVGRRAGAGRGPRRRPPAGARARLGRAGRMTPAGDGHPGRPVPPAGQDRIRTRPIPTARWRSP